MPVITVYILRSKINGKRYVGITADLSQRLVDHKKRGATVTRQLGAFELIHTEEHPDYLSARVREKFLKSGQGREWIDLKFGVAGVASIFRS